MKGSLQQKMIRSALISGSFEKMDQGNIILNLLIFCVLAWFFWPAAIVWVIICIFR